MRSGDLLSKEGILCEIFFFDAFEDEFALIKN